MNKVLITGAAGFIGSHVADCFRKNGHEVIGWDCAVAAGQVEVHTVDLSDRESVIRQLDAFRPDVIVHCAGSADVGKSVRDPSADFVGNVTITHNLLFAMHALQMMKTRFVFLSSAGVYGNPAALPITEDMPLKPMSPYALHKVMCEELCRYFVDNYGADIKIARIFSAYGAGLKKQIFWDMHRKAQSTGRLDMFGTGMESRDYIHIADVSKAIYLIATEESSHMIFNVANGEETTIRKATEYFSDFAGVPHECISFTGCVREGDPINWRADITRMTDLGYRKSVDMETGLREYVQWAKTQG